MFPSARVVKFETTTLSIGTKHDVYKKNLVKSEAYRNVPEVTIQNALDMIGEQKWSLFGKWSSDFATECVIVDLDRYYNRGYRFARLVQSQCFDLFYGETLRRCQDFGLDRISFQESGSGLERISYLINFLMKFPRKRNAWVAASFSSLGLFFKKKHDWTFLILPALKSYLLSTFSWF